VTPLQTHDRMACAYSAGKPARAIDWGFDFRSLNLGVVHVLVGNVRKRTPGDGLVTGLE
jgi:hypothetical protein